jgi:hypothetical protein
MNLTRAMRDEAKNFLASASWSKTLENGEKYTWPGGPAFASSGHMTIYQGHPQSRWRTVDNDNKILRLSNGEIRTFDTAEEAAWALLCQHQGRREIDGLTCEQTQVADAFLAEASKIGSAFRWHEGYEAYPVISQDLGQTKWRAVWKDRTTLEGGNDGYFDSAQQAALAIMDAKSKQKPKSNPGTPQATAETVAPIRGDAHQSLGLPPQLAGSAAERFAKAAHLFTTREWTGGMFAQFVTDLGTQRIYKALQEAEDRTTQPVVQPADDPVGEPGINYPKLADRPSPDVSRSTREPRKVLHTSVHLKLTEQPIDHECLNAYQKGAFYCIYQPDERVVKYPIADIWRIVEDYGRHDGR